MIKAIIFDYYGVLTTDRFLTWLLRHPQVAQKHAKGIETLSHDQDEGIGDREFFSRLAAFAGVPEDEVRAEFDIHGVAHQGLVAYIRHLRRHGLKTAILSNSDVGLYDQVRSHHWNRTFDLVLCSEEAGVTKPDPEIYKLALDRLGVSAREALFVDDRTYNVRGAEAAGIEGILYTGLTDFRAELIRRAVDN